MGSEAPYWQKALAYLNWGIAGGIAFAGAGSDPGWWRVALLWFLAPTIALPLLFVLNPEKKKGAIAKEAYGMFLFGPLVLLLLPILIVVIVLVILFGSAETPIQGDDLIDRWSNTITTWRRRFIRLPHIRRERRQQ